MYELNAAEEITNELAIAISRFKLSLCCENNPVVGHAPPGVSNSSLCYYF
jgi:hypothetical protein